MTDRPTDRPTDHPNNPATGHPTGRHSTAHDLHEERTLLVDTAWRQVAAHGTETTPESIAEAAGLPLDRLRQHFPTPDDLLSGVIDEYFSRVMAVCLRHTDGWSTPRQAAATWYDFVRALMDLEMGAVSAQVTPESFRERAHIVYHALVPRQERLYREVGAVLRRAADHGLVGDHVTTPSFLMGVAAVSRPVPAPSEAMARRQRGWLTGVFLRGLRPDGPGHEGLTGSRKNN